MLYHADPLAHPVIYTCILRTTPISLPHPIPFLLPFSLCKAEVIQESQNCSLAPPHTVFKHREGRVQEHRQYKTRIVQCSLQTLCSSGKSSGSLHDIQVISQARIWHQDQCSSNAEKLFWTKSSSHPGIGKACVTCLVLALENEQPGELHKASRHGDPPYPG